MEEDPATGSDDVKDAQAARAAHREAFVVDWELVPSHSPGAGVPRGNDR